MFQEKSFLNLFLLSFLFTILTVLSSPALVTAAQLMLSWSDNSTNEVGFRIERRTGTTGTYAEIATVGVNTASYTDVNLPNGTTYCYRVRAYNAGGTSGYSNEQCGTTLVATSYALTVAKSGTGGGVVTATGINCGTDCSEPYTSGSSVTLTATPSSGSSFAGWSGTGWNGSGCQGTADCTMTISSNATITATFVNNQADKVGIYRPSTGDWFLDQNGNGTWDGCSTDKCVESFTTGGALPVVGKWNRSGGTRLGLFFPATAQWRLDINSDEILEACGVDRCLGPFGEATDIPVAGKWSSAGYDRIGIFRPSSERWYMDVNGNGLLNNCSKDRCASLSVYRDGDLPVTGDWNGDGVTQVGLYRPSTGQWFLDRNGDRSWDGCPRDLCISGFGTAEDLPVTGDWNGEGRSKVGLFRPRTGEWLLDLNGNNQWDGCDIDLCLKDFGDVGDIPVAGKW